MAPRKRPSQGGSAKQVSTSPLTTPSPSPSTSASVSTKRRKIAHPKTHGTAGLESKEDEFQQVTRDEFVRAHKLDVGYGGDVYYQPDFLPPDTASEWYDELMVLDTCELETSDMMVLQMGRLQADGQGPTLKMYGRSFPQSRRIAAYATQPGMTLSYSGTQVAMHHPFPPVLAGMQAQLEVALGVRFNHCMLNRYDDGSVYIGKHSDNLNNLVIASVSLGAERTFILSPRLPRGVKAEAKTGADTEAEDINVKAELSGRKSHRWTLANGSLVVMQGRTQEYWKHEIPKEMKVKAGRISLTFRQLV